ncbi:ATP-binding protein [Streptomyces sparsogenes]|uniref:ATP-binding protein n=1 Tax=Streptomyces sparsogenes TaxID=67365 RepID=UPI0033C8E64E
MTFSAPAVPEAVGILRRRASRLFAVWMPDPGERDSAALVVSELLTNAVVHGGSTMELTLGFRDRILAITVTDRGLPEKVAVLRGEGPDECGRGLDIVAALAGDVHSEQQPEGWCVRVRMMPASACSDSGRPLLNAA